ncbi:MAG: hypothetical protein WBF14_11025 [Candidatus Acidiferrales bacterium]
MNSLRKLAARALRKGARIIEPPEESRILQDEYLLWLSYANPGMLERKSVSHRLRDWASAQRRADP